MRRMSWLVALLAACTYQPRTLETSGPVAVIGDGSAEYRVAADSHVFLDGSRSHDPDGGELRFSWSIEQGCTNDALEPSQLLQPVVEFVSLASGGCQVSLTVTDEDNLSDTATALVELVVVGTHVAATNCVDPGSDMVGKGGPENPWCSPLDGVAAAVTFHLTDVWIASGDFELTESLVVPAGMAVHGGLDPNNQWRQGSAFSSLGLLGNARVLLEAGEGALLSSLAIFRLDDSSSMDFDLVTLRGASARIVDCTIGATPDLSSQRTIGPTPVEAIARSLHVVSGEAAVFVSVTNSRIVMPEIVGRAYGVYLDGRGGELSAEIVDSLLVGTADAETGAALRTLATKDVEVRGSTIIPVSVYDNAGFVFGVLDGMAGGVGFAPDRMDVPCAQQVCFASHGLVIVDTTVLVSSVTNAVAVALMGSVQATVHSTTNAEAVAVGADAVVGVWSYGTDAVTVRGMVANAESYTDYATQGFAVGVLDGAGELGTDGEPASLSGGSSNLLIDGVMASAGQDIGRTVPTVVAGIALLGTRDSEIRATGFNAAAAPSAQPLVALGLWTLATERLEVGTSFWAPNPSRPTQAVHLVAAHADGWPGRINVGSVDLLVADNQFGANLHASDPESLAACVLWSATSGDSALRRNTVACAPSVARDLFHGILTLETARVDVEANHISRAPSADAVSISATMVGIRDGLADVIAGSSRLRVTRNWVFSGNNQLYDNSIGVWIDHRMPPVSEPRVKLQNNALFGAGAVGASSGVVLNDAEVEVVNNTIHAGECDDVDAGTGECLGPLITVGVEVHGAARSPANGTEVWLANNLIHPGFGYYATSVADKDATIVGGSITEMSVSVFKDNRLVVPPDLGAPGEVNLYVASDDSDQVVGVSSGMMLITMLNAQGDPSRFVSALLLGQVLCTDDNVHIDSSLDPVQLEGQADPAYAPSKDIDGTARDAVAPDIGADEVDGTPCGGY